MPPTDPNTYFLQQGILGVIIVVLGAVIIWLVKRIAEKDKIIENRDVIIRELQQKRVEDYKDIAERNIVTQTNLLSGMQALKESNQSTATAITEVLRNISGRVS